MADAWSPTSWRALPALQQPKYPDAAHLERCLSKLRRLPPLVAESEVEALRGLLAECAQGKRFLLQGGDCAERFEDCSAESIEKKLKTLLQMSLVVTHGARRPTVRVGRIAGQYSKPRSSDTEVVDGVEHPSYRGDNVNGFDLSQRAPDPERLLQGYFHSAATVNYARVVLAEGLADLRRAGAWDYKGRRQEYNVIAERIISAMSFLETCGVTLDPILKSVDFFISHEGLHLALEEAMTAESAVNGKFYNRGAHFLWIGDRTRQLDHAHVEYFRGIANPVGLKVGPSTVPAELVLLIRRLWPDPAATPGKVTLITRFGADNVRAMLPPHIRAVREAGLPVVWSCDPMHGNTTTAASGHKTRDFDAVLREVEQCIDVHTAQGSCLGGVHFELTGDDVTECTGGPAELLESELPQRYTSLCDPRLNNAQSVEMAFRVTQHLLGSDSDKASAADGKASAADGKASAADGKASAADGKASAADGKEATEVATDSNDSNPKRAKLAL